MPSPSSHVQWLGALVAITAIAATNILVQAATCSQTQTQSIDSLYQSAAKRSGCAPYASVSPGGSSAVDIQYTCTTTSCFPALKDLARQLPDCELPSTGVNKKQQLEDGLYTTCKLCTDTQDTEIQSLWQAAAKTTACDEYARSSSLSTSFSWPCSASSCTSVIENLAGKVPDCFTGTVNEKDHILRAVRICKSSVKTPAPVTSTSRTPFPSPSTAAPSFPNCTHEERKESARLWEKAAKTSWCESFSVVTSTQVIIQWPCTTADCTSVMATLGANLPACLLPGSFKSEKETLQTSVQKCRANGTYSSSTASPTPGGGITSGSGAMAATPSPTPTFSASLCTKPQATAMTDAYMAIATSADCKPYTTSATPQRITVNATCYSTCVTTEFHRLAVAIPDCFYSYDAENKQRQVQQMLAICSKSSGSSQYVAVSFGAASTMDAASARAVESPATSRASRVLGVDATQWLAVVVALAAFVMARAPN